MNEKISEKAHEIVIDELFSRFFILGGSVWVYDLKTNEKIARLNDISYPTCVCVSRKNNMVFVQSTDGRFAFYTADSLTFLGKLKIRGCQNTDEDFYYDEEENIVYGIFICSRGDGGVGYGLAELYPDKLQYSTIYLPQLDLEREKQDGEKPYTRYAFHKHAKGGYYIIRNWYNVGAGAARIYENCYGRFEKEGKALVLKEKLLRNCERTLEKMDITEGENAAYIYKFCKTIEREYFVRIRKNERGLFLITSKAVYHLLSDGEFEEVCRGEYISDYAEFGGRRYICAWNRCLVRDMEKDPL